MNCVAENQASKNDTTIDSFHRGQFYLVQPKKGHRSGMDAMMLAGVVPNGFNGKVADLGSGSGAAGLAVASRCKDAHVTLIENAPLSILHAKETLKLTQNAALAKRINLIEADVTLTGKKRVAAGLEDQSFDFVMMNPPYNPSHERATPSPHKAQAHVMNDSLFEDWLRTASALSKPGAGFAMIARPMSLNDILTAAQGRYGNIAILPLCARQGEAATRIIVSAIRGSRAELKLLSPLIIHGDDGNAFSALADGISNGKMGLFDK